MSRLRYSRAGAEEHLRRQCPKLGAFVEIQGRFRLRAARDPDVFCALSRAIVYQQLSGKAAGTIHRRFCGLFDNGCPEPSAAAGMDTERLRAAGLSRNKALSVQDLARRALDGSLAGFRRLGRMSDEAVVTNLCQVRGIGPWTAQMFLMFNLGRPDVMPTTDLGVQKGVQAIYGLQSLPTPDRVLRVTRHLAPYRSAASWYFWRAADTDLMTR